MILSHSDFDCDIAKIGMTDFCGIIHINLSDSSKRERKFDGIIAIINTVAQWE